MALWTAAAPLLVDLAERAFKSLVVEEACTHTEEEKCDKDKHLRPTPIGALFLLAAFAGGTYLASVVNNSSSQLELLQKDVKELKSDVGDIKNFLTYGKPLYHASTTPTPAVPALPILPPIQIIPPAYADPLDMP